MEDENSAGGGGEHSQEEGPVSGMEQGDQGNTEARALAAAVGRYRDLVAQTPGLVPEMVHGSTIDEVDASAERARQAYSSISRRVAEQYEAIVPTGNPARSAGNAAYNNLTPEAKIAMGLKRHG